MSQCRQFTAPDITRLIGKYGWEFEEQQGSHAQHTHPVLSGRVTIERHAAKDLPFDIVKSIFCHAGMEHFLRMFQQGASYKTVKKAIQAEARERFGTPEREPVRIDTLPRPGVS